MSEISEHYAVLADAFAAKVAAVPAGAWDDPTPCADWSVRDLVGHVVETHGTFLGFVGSDPGDVPSVDDDPVAAFDAARTAVQAHLDDPARASVTFEGSSGPRRFDEAVDQFIGIDLIVHGWDLACATGQDERIDPAEVRRVVQATEGLGAASRSPEVFGPALDPPPGADEQTRVLAYLGRRSW